MFKPILNLSKVTGWAITSGAPNAAHTVVCEIQPGPRFHNISIIGNAGTAKLMTDLVSDIRVIANDEVVRLHSADELNKKNMLYGTTWNAYNGGTAAAEFHLPIHFAEPWRKDSLTGDKLAWNTRNLRTFRVEVDVKASTFTSPTALRFQAEADSAPLDTDAPGLMGLIVKIGRTNINLASGWNDIMQLPRKGIYQEINVVQAPTSSGITELEIKQGDKTRLQLTYNAIVARLKQRDMVPISAGSGDNPTRTMTDIIFDADDRPTSGLISDPAADFLIRLNAASALGNTVVLYNTLEPL